MQKSLVACVKSFQPLKCTHSSCNWSSCCKKVFVSPVSMSDRTREMHHGVTGTWERNRLSCSCEAAKALLSTALYFSLLPPPSFALPPLVHTQAALKDQRTLNLATRIHQGQLEYYFQNPQLGHSTLIGWAGSWKESERINVGVFEVLSLWVDSGRIDGFVRKK